jgi:hypothetical protein
MFQSTPDDIKRVHRARRFLLGIGCGCMALSAAIVFLWLYLNSL